MGTLRHPELAGDRQACECSVNLVIRPSTCCLSGHMILKEKDSLEDQLQDLEQALRNATHGQERQRYEKELALVRAGLKGEQEAAYHIDFHLKDNGNWAVIHDLRVEWNGRVAQIDHLLIDRLLEIYVVESKSFRTKIRHANGGWERLNFNHWEGIPCPIEQNNRHIMVLEELIQAAKLAPTRLGMVLRPKFFNVVVVQPSCSIVGKLPQDARIYRMDQLVTKIRSTDPSALDILKLVAPETIHSLAVDLVGHHKPAPKRQIAVPQSKPRPAEGEGNGVSQSCEGCGGPLTNAEAYYCRTNARKFAGKLLCRNCQAQPAGMPKSPPAETGQLQSPEQVVARCANCGIGVDKKVVAYCRFNSKRLGGRVLCRSCQASAA